jgi:glycolate oxidase FAD binding subunit
VTPAKAQDLQDMVGQVSKAASAGRSLCICGGESKSFLGRDLGHLTKLDVSAHTGIINYEPAELVIQVRAGTPLTEILQLLESNNQLLAFDPPVFENATIGGTVATGLSGSRRPYAGAVRDFVLGVDIITGMGELLSFGGQVMKNVAGYDASRLMVGAMGCLGVITEVSLKVLPKPEVEETRVVSMSAPDALERMLQLASQSQLVSATAFYKGSLYVRFSGADKSVSAEAAVFGGEKSDSGFWKSIDTLTLFEQDSELWRISTAPDNRCFIREAALLDWGGGQRWLVDPVSNPRTDLGPEQFATLVKGLSTDEKYHPLKAPVLQIHQGLKRQFDPKGILNPGKMYSTF